jgi:threonine synthase
MVPRDAVARPHITRLVGSSIVKYISTRGDAPVLDFNGALMAGLARDGGLYVPDGWPQVNAGEIAALAGKPYAAVAANIMGRFTEGSLTPAELAGITEAAYARFSHKAAAPLVQIADNIYVLELFHGPTLAFKDFAMQVLGPLMDRELARQGSRATVIGATSGDTGAAAIEAFKGRECVDVFILYPHGRVSDVQRRQMTTVADSNVHTLAVEGTFDDCQNIVKALLGDAELRELHRLSAVNSINWARIAAQVPYYFSAAASLGAPHRAVSFAVPTGNFGDIFAGFAALQMGLPLKRLIIATNANDILVRTLETGRYQPCQVIATSSPSMDIQISSNFERLVYEASGRDSAAVREKMAALKEAGTFELNAGELAWIRKRFAAFRAPEETVIQTIREVYAESGYIADPHTATGIAAAKAQAAHAPEDGPFVVLSTAHRAKFPDAIKHAVGFEPHAPIRLKTALAADERFTVLPASAAAVASFISSRKEP